MVYQQIKRGTGDERKECHPTWIAAVSACPKCRFPVTFGGGSNCRPDNEEIKSIKKHGKMNSATRRLTHHLLVIE